MALRGKTTVVTGAAAGVGLAMVEMFRERGATVVAVDIDRPGLDRLAGRHPDVIAVAVDISTPAGAEQAMDAGGGRVDVLCSNAGIMDRFALVDEVTDEEWNRVLAVNLTAPMLLSRIAIPRMIEQGGGAIVNTASVGGLRGGRAGAAYTASKFGLVGLTQNIAATFGDQGIRCNAICPGSIATDILKGGELSPRGAAIGSRDRDKPAPAAPEQIAAAALFLADDEASRVNGVALPVDGGWIAY
jgi:NAD(P)-dependent dehydrogenase (short-subunit alcohol dehydrogenase family)